MIYKQEAGATALGVRDTYTPEPSRPCSPEIVCLCLYQYWKSSYRVRVSGEKEVRRRRECTHGVYGKINIPESCSNLIAALAGLEMDL